MRQADSLCRDGGEGVSESGVAHMFSSAAALYKLDHCGVLYAGVPCGVGVAFKYQSCSD